MQGRPGTRTKEGGAMSEAEITKRARGLCRSLAGSHRTAFTDDDGVTWRVRCPNCASIREAFRALLVAR